MNNRAVLFTLARMAEEMGAYRLARHAYERLQQQHVPARFRDRVDLGSLALKAKPFSDDQVYTLEIYTLTGSCATSQT